jgi:hypothetical protein
MALMAGRRSSRVWAGIAVTTLLLLWVSGAFDFGQLLFVERLQAIGSDSDDSFAARGYSVLIENARTAYDVLFGFGANGVKVLHGNEVHSTYIAFFAVYGLVGGSLYLAFILSWLWELFRVVSFSRLIAIAGPPLFYGIAHNGTRFSIFYAMIALSLALCEERRISIRRTRAQPVPEWMLASDPARSGRADVPGRNLREGRQT